MRPSTQVARKTNKKELGERLESVAGEGARKHNEVALAEVLVPDSLRRQFLIA